MIWCVEDDENIREIEVYSLRSTGFEARGFAEGRSFFAALEKEKPDLILLDIMLPEMDGVAILQRLKADKGTADIPVIMATAKGAEHEKVRSLDIGADDYLVKPFGMMEMVSRVKAVLRRCKKDGSDVLLKAGGILLHKEERTVSVDGARIELTFKEFELLRLFWRSRGRLFPGNSCFFGCGGTTMWERREPLICISERCAQNSENTAV